MKQWAPGTAAASILLLLIKVTVSSTGASSPRLFQHTASKSKNYLTKEEFWFNQTIDHFSPYDRRQFGQRYYEYLDNFRIPDGPIFLKICGESACDGIVNDYLGVLAKKFGAALVSLEHRYYGKSSPFKSLTTENLRYLSSKQALFDLASFRHYYQESLNVKLNRSNMDNPWFVFGVSYAGALSAWFRIKFPHLTCGSLASSAVVLAVYNFTEFDKQIGESAGPECKSVLQEITRLVDQRLGANDKALRTLFGAAEEAYATYVKEYYIKGLGVSVETYDQQHLKETALTSDSDRLWWFQVCTEVAYFQVAPSNDSIRSTKVDTRYHLDLCKNVFEESIYPDVSATNLCYGGTRIGGSKIIFTNGSQDPWRHASKQTSSPEMPSYIMKCRNCGHGTDMRGCPQSPLVPEGDSKNCSAPDAVNKVRQHVIEHIDLWLSQCQSSGRNFM
ncbi:probable serine protease EDA2 isoform X2 [Primulina eburnea]|uniref:probable serine protease EDA2 isoform X2 n=1 Tax=Primulina eburnea TaxID=1245227 RepID=UPI003C6C1EB5